MKITVAQLCSCTTLSGPHSFDEASKQPGVYRFKNYTLTAAMVVKKNGDVLYVTDREAIPFEKASLKPINEIGFIKLEMDIPEDD